MSREKSSEQKHPEHAPWLDIDRTPISYRHRSLEEQLNVPNVCLATCGRRA